MPSDSAGLTLDSTGSSDAIADTGGAGTGGFSSWSKSKKTAVFGGGFAVLAIGAFLYARSKSASTTAASSSTTTPVTVAGATAGNGQSGNGGNVLAGLLGIGTGVTNLANSLSTMKAGTEQITNNYTQAAPTAPIAPSQNSSQSTGLPPINASAWPSIIKFGQDPNAATDFTGIGTVNNGVFSGTNVTGGVPVYAGVLGGYAQGFNESTLPNNTELYIPTALTQYEGSHT